MLGAAKLNPRRQEDSLCPRQTEEMGRDRRCRELIAVKRWQSLGEEVFYN